MAKDSTFTYVHLTASRHADLFEDFTRTKLQPEDIFIPPSRLPPNPEDEDDVVPDQHAAFGIQRATQARREPAWKDLGLAEIVDGGGLAGLSLEEGGTGAASGGDGVGGGVEGGSGAGMRRRVAGGAMSSGTGFGWARGAGMGAGDGQLAIAGMGRGAGIGVGVGGMGLGRGEVRARGGVADVGARRGVVPTDRGANGILPR